MSKPECGVCYLPESIFRLSCCNFVLCVPCGDRIKTRSGLKCPGCRELHDEVPAVGSGLESATSKSKASSSDSTGSDDKAADKADDDLAVALAASALEFEEERKLREVYDSEWQQQLDAALNASVEAERAKRAASVREQAELKAALAQSKRVWSWEDEQLLWAGVEPLQVEPVSSDIEVDEGAEDARPSSGDKGVSGLKRPSVALDSSVPVKRSKVSPSTEASEASQGKEVGKYLSVDNVQSLDGYKLIRNPKGRSQGVEGKRPLRLAVNGGNADDPRVLDVDVSMKAALELSMRPAWMDRRERERERLGLSPDGLCGGDSSRGCSSNCRCEKK